MKASDYLAEFLSPKVGHVFGLQGGAVTHIFDSCERLGPRPVYCHHEQAAAFAACAYARIKGYGVCVVTTGPGAFNALTPCLGAWQDSIPMMFISGQQRSEFTSYGLPVRQVASQEAPICDTVYSITKFRSVVMNPEVLSEVLEDAYRYSVDGRPGPVWIDVCQDVLWSKI